MKKIRLIAIGKLKTPFFKEAAKHYLWRIQHHLSFEEVNPKDADPKLPVAEAIKQEGQNILACLKSSDIVICLDEKGKEFTSEAFANFLEQISENQSFCPTFIIGGAFGLSEAVKKQAKYTISLSKMTLPHELARVFFLEQLYRADAILRKSPYHHV
ncbi:23S rRNA (pseudouridine(1915)-N(3))-methyltransferase RlmH [Desulfovibrio litoralis]|uniref:Ribosomal RNA large subunit methyltransferase H n=1 Tax=Desulfovibrio litoralis DSM 11393 TaxID=1121455 RepID=A0A1M7T4K2_9BACT|nr:23S rRNA (pseudouridine(1915)-N(3))-methyltransferase RlmH [Desulfovibrio litoralis]SHN65602.1 23S rRNA (pseudouridine1915-N3)-methyltransferase [Desulfovibrio litoralis DSM 11393]